MCLYVDGKSVTGLIIMLGQAPIFVKSSKQKIVTMKRTWASLCDNTSEMPTNSDSVVALYRMYTYVYSGIPLKTSNITVYLLRHFYI